MKSITWAIEVFEAKIIEIRLAYRTKGGGTLAEMIEIIAERDEELAKCLWAIEALDDAYKSQKDAELKVKKVTGNVFSDIF